MISLRRHILTLAAVFLALAIGIVLGSTSVADSIHDSMADEDRSTAAQLDGAREDLEASRSDAARLDAMAATLAPSVAGSALARRPVSVVVTPGASQDDVARVVDAVQKAGGTPAGTVTVTDKALDPAADAELQAMVANLPLGTAPAADADLGAQLGTALGQAAQLRPDDARPHLEDRDRDTVLTTLAGSGFVRYDKGTVRPGQLAVVVAGPDGGPDGMAGTRVAALATALDREGAGTTVATQLSGGAHSDAVSALRSGGATGVSTVDDLDSDAGRLAVVLAAAEQLSHRQGHYGLRADASAAVPAPLGPENAPAAPR